MFCPICHRLYEAGYVICPACEVSLLEQDAEPIQEQNPTERACIIKSGRELACLICGGTQFTQITGCLTIKESSYPNFTADARETINYICSNCGYIHGFMDVPSQFFRQNDLIDNEGNTIDYETSKALPGECPICFSKIQSGDRECANCGHKL